jgi:hypothetical protein
MTLTGKFVIALLAAVGAMGLIGSQQAAAAGGTEPIDVTKYPFIEIFSPTFFWSDEVDFVRTGSITCPKGRAITGGLSILQGKASLRVLESYPDGESWLIRVVNRLKPDAVQSLQVRGFALCLLSAARKASVQMAQQTKLLLASSKVNLASGLAETTGRQVCPQGALVVSGGFGVDPTYRGPASPRLELSYPDPNGWNVRAINAAAGSEPAAEARIYALCLGTKEGVDIKNFHSITFAEKDMLVAPDNAVGKTTVPCAEGSYVLAGGSRTYRGRSANVEMQESFPDSPSSWTVGVINRGDKKAGEVTIKAFAVCLGK